MAVTLFKEMFEGKYDGVTSPVLLPVGALSDGANVRKVSAAGGWKPRKGVDAHNTTAIAAASVLSLHQYTHPRNGDYHFLAQCNGNLYDATNDPPASGTTFAASALSALASSTVPGFSDMVRETFVYADGDGAPVQWGGDNPFCEGFVVSDNGEENSFTKEVVDGRSDTNAVLAVVKDVDAYYVCSPCVAKGIKLDLGTVNAVDTAVLNVEAWRSSAWVGVTGISDGTEDSGCTHGKDGTISWTAGADTMKVIAGVMGYWYKVYVGTADMTAGVSVISCQVIYDPARMTNKWDGVYLFPSAVRFYDQSATEYVNLSGKLTNESTSQYLQLDAATTSDFIYIKTIEPATGFGLGVVDEYENTALANIDLIEYWDGSDWGDITITAALDETTNEAGTASLSQTGTVWWDGTAYTPKRRRMDFDSSPGFWYRISWDLDFDNAADDVRLFMITYATFPESLPNYKGVIEFKNRTFVWGDPEFPNRLRYSAMDKPDCFSGYDSGYTDAFGNMEEIICAVRFYNELLVFKANSVWLLEGFMTSNFGATRVADTVGLAAAKTAMMVETGYQNIHKDEPRSVVLWTDTDGVYTIDGRKPLKISGPIDHYFNTEYSTAMEATKIDDCQAFVDRLNNEYHLLIPYSGTQGDVELVYNYITEEWYPPWERRVGGANDYLVCGLSLRGTGGRYYTYGGGSAGRVYRLEIDTSDKDVSDADIPITHSIKTRAISATQKKSTTLDFTLRKAWIEAKARTSPTTKTITTKFYKDLATSGTTITTPAAIDLANSGYDLLVDNIDTDQTRCKTFQLEFEAARIDLELELYSFLYALEALGELDV